MVEVISKELRAKLPAAQKQTQQSLRQNTQSLNQLQSQRILRQSKGVAGMHKRKLLDKKLQTQKTELTTKKKEIKRLEKLPTRDEYIQEWVRKRNAEVAAQKQNWERDTKAIQTAIDKKIPSKLLTPRIRKIVSRARKSYKPVFISHYYVEPREVLELSSKASRTQPTAQFRKKLFQSPKKSSSWW